MKFILTAILITFFTTSAISENLNKDLVAKKRHSESLSEIKADDPQAQNEINELKKEFFQEREKINQRYELRIKDLKKNRKNEVDRLKKKYKQRMKRLRKKYPSIPEIDIEAKPKPKPKPPENTDRMKLYEKNKVDSEELKKRKDTRRKKRYRMKQEIDAKEKLKKNEDLNKNKEENKDEK